MKILQIESSIEGQKSLLTEDRVYLAEGKVQWLENDIPKGNRHLFLFSDILLITKLPKLMKGKKLVSKETILIRDLRIQSVSDAQGKNRNFNLREYTLIVIWIIAKSQSITLTIGVSRSVTIIFLSMEAKQKFYVKLEENLNNIIDSNRSVLSRTKDLEMGSDKKRSSSLSTELPGTYELEGESSSGKQQPNSWIPTLGKYHTMKMSPRRCSALGQESIRLLYSPPTAREPVRNTSFQSFRRITVDSTKNLKNQTLVDEVLIGTEFGSRIKFRPPSTFNFSVAPARVSRM